MYNHLEYCKSVITIFCSFININLAFEVNEPEGPSSSVAAGKIPATPRKDQKNMSTSSHRSTYMPPLRAPLRGIISFLSVRLLSPRRKERGRLQHAPPLCLTTLPSTPSTSSVGAYVMGTQYQTRDTVPPTSSEVINMAHSSSLSTTSTDSPSTSGSSSSSATFNADSSCSFDLKRGGSVLCEPKEYNLVNEVHPLPSLIPAFTMKANNEDKGLMQEEIQDLLDTFENVVGTANLSSLKPLGGTSRNSFKMTFSNFILVTILSTYTYILYLEETYLMLFTRFRLSLGSLWNGMMRTAGRKLFQARSQSTHQRLSGTQANATHRLISEKNIPLRTWVGSWAPV
ncbi:hypothetical protein M422DRAFT_54156 [Sphaerobolus stellatus SS14]|uniref:Uncharacterized protein n=1 Tax=Sphaerobolus stellatus (strain SS14) TaxID=990650 RepID=A0A0C9UWE1_SPHS4|nr:hypothetical protein M422DRAFT_54156 [Sphaerobolus stellatus SS14]